MKDRVALLLAGLIASGFAWAFWHYLGARAFDVLSTLVMVTLVADNIRLRRKLRHKRIRAQTDSGTDHEYPVPTAL
jgi:hypothetical protein